MGVDDGAGGFFAEDLGLLRRVEAGAEVAAMVVGSVCGGSGDRWGRWGGFTCRCS